MADLLFAFTEWLRTTFVVELSLWISNTAASVWIGTHFWAIPIIQTIHILAIALAFGSALMINLRILGLAGAGRTFGQTAGRYQPWIGWAFLVLVVTGLGMIVGEPVRELVNPIFWIKMGLIVALILASLGFHNAVRRDFDRRELAGGGLAGVRTGAVLLILLWCAVMLAGRWIAYAPV